MERLFVFLGAAFALIGVAAGAFGAHALQERLAADRLAVFDTAVRYQMYHALGLLGAAWAAARWPGTLTTLAGWLFAVGILIFAGTLYALAFGAPRFLGAITPLGGVSFLAGWLLLALAALRG